MKNLALVATTGILVLGSAQGPAAAAPPLTPTAHSKVYHTETVIAAAPATIWGVMMDLPRYGEWNPWLIHAEGDMVEGGSVQVDVILNGNTQKADHTVVTVEPYTRFCWKDAGWTTIFAPAQRCRTLTVQADGTVKYVNELIIFGVLAWVVDLSNGASLRSGMEGENAGLKHRAESL